MKRKRIFIPLVISLVLVLSLLSLGAGGCPSSNKYNLTTNVSPNGSGSISPSGGSYDPGVTVTITASANSGYVFDYWSGSASGTGPNTSITMDEDKDIVANFAATGPEVLFSDNFSQDTGDWDVYSDENGDVFYEGGWLHVMNYTTAPEDTETMLDGYFDDFILEVETKLVDGTDNNWHGVICRLQDLSNYYVFNISADGYYYISKFLDYEQISLSGPTLSGYVNTGWDVVNTMHIECIGSTLSFSVNGHLLDTITDNSFDDGDIGLLATSWESDLSEIAFDNLVITEP